MKSHQDRGPEGRYDTYETFLCYRGESIGNSASLEIAQVVYDVIHDDPSFGGVFFAEGTGIRYDFLRDAAPIIRSVRKFVVVLCHNFFSGFFLPGGTALDPQSATAEELRLAFESNCDLYPIFSGEFSWADVNPETMGHLEACYGRENISKLRNRANVYRWHQARNDPREIANYLSEIGVDGVLWFFRELPEETTRDYEVSLTDFAKKYNTRSMRSWLRDILEGYPDEQDAVHYAAFYTLQMMLRYSKDFDKMRDLFSSCRQRFSEHATYHHIWLLYIMESETEADADTLLQLAYRDWRSLPDNAGFVHLFPSLYALVCEKASGKRLEETVKTWGNLAREAAERAIELDGTYAKFYCTKARVLAIQGDFAKAEREINRAIALEDSQRVDYLIRLADYQYYKIMVQLGKRFYDQTREKEQL